jgi:hypothetical protein
VSLYWTRLNKGRRWVTLDLRAPEGRVLLSKLLAATGSGGGITLALAGVALAVAGHLGFLAEAQVNRTEWPRTGNHLFGALGRDFATADGKRIMVVALTRRHFADLAAVTALTGIFTELKRLLEADFDDDDDRYRHRGVITALLEPWFDTRTLAEIQRELSGSAVRWSPYLTFAELAAGGALGEDPLLQEISQPGVGVIYAPLAPFVMKGLPGVRPRADSRGGYRVRPERIPGPDRTRDENWPTAGSSALPAVIGDGREIPMPHPTEPEGQSVAQHHVLLAVRSSRWRPSWITRTLTRDHVMARPRKRPDLGLTIDECDGGIRTVAAGRDPQQSCRMRPGQLPSQAMSTAKPRLSSA